MTHIHDAIRDNMLIRDGVSRPPVKKMPCICSLRQSEWSSEFEQKMRNRLIMGAFRYETFEEKAASPWEYDTAAEAIVRVKRYIETGNTEHLVDAANMCLLEYEFGRHPNKHFESIDDGTHAVKKGR